LALVYHSSAGQRTSALAAGWWIAVLERPRLGKQVLKFVRFSTKTFKSSHFSSTLNRYLFDIKRLSYNFLNNRDEIKQER
jgi:hypothetical protein